MCSCGGEGRMLRNLDADVRYRDMPICEQIGHGVRL